MSADGSAPRHPPYSLEAEMSTLGGVILENSAFYAVAGVVAAEDFYIHAHQVIWQALQSMAKAGKPMDFVTITEVMRDSGKLDEAGGISYLGSLAHDTPSAANVLAYAERVREMAQRRRLIAYGRDLAERAWTAPADELTGTVTAGVAALLSKTTATSKRFSEACNDAEVSIKAARTRLAAGGTVGAPIGLETLDRLTGGFSGPRLIVMAARPKCGKSALLNQFAVHASRNGWPGLIVSLELGADELAIRAMANYAQVNVTRLHRGQKEEFDRATEAIPHLGDIPLWLDTDSTRLDAICAQIALHKHRHSIKWAAVDHIGLVNTQERFTSRNDQMGHITSTLKQLTKRLDIPIVALSQLNRKCDAENRRPRPDDLRDSGNIEQDCDAVMMLHVAQDQRSALIKSVQIGVPMNRMGPSCWPDVLFEFNGSTQTFSETTRRPDAD